jgi:hypothetical protein
MQEENTEHSDYERYNALFGTNKLKEPKTKIPVTDPTEHSHTDPLNLLWTSTFHHQKKMST